MASPDYLLLTRDGCGLCEEFEHALRAQHPQLAVAMADVDSRDDWRRRYGLRIPVLLDRWGEAVAEGVFPEAGLELPLGSP